MKPKSKCTPEEWEKQLEYRRKRYAENLYKERLRSRESKRKDRQKDPERINHAQRRRYKSDPNGAEKQNARRQKREPNRFIRAAAKLYAEGAITSKQLNQRISDALAWSDQTTIGTGVRSSKSIGVEHRPGTTEHGNNGEANTDESKLHKGS